MSNAWSYAWGQCTYFVATALGWVPAGLGDAKDWLTNARAKGLPTSDATATPQVGSVIVWGAGQENGSNPAGPAGHVAEVVGIQANGLPIVKEMNFTGPNGGGVGVTDTRALPNLNGVIGYIYAPGTVTGPSVGVPSAELTGQTTTSSSAPWWSSIPILGGALNAGQGVASFVGAILDYHTWFTFGWFMFAGVLAFMGLRLITKGDAGAPSLTVIRGALEGAVAS